MEHHKKLYSDFINYIDDDLLQQKKMLMNILNLTITQYTNMYDALVQGNSKLAEKVYLNDETINQLHDNFINISLWKIAKQQMVAKDLRQVVTFLIIVREIERIADYAAHLSNYYLKYQPSNKLIKSEIKEPIEKLLKMLKYIRKIIASGDLTLAYSIPTFENKINVIFKRNTKMLLKKLQTTSDGSGVKLINVTLQQLKYIERAGDHLVNIAELLIYIKEGKFFE